MSSNYPPFGSAAALRCQRCGNPLPPNEAYCGNCGFNNTQLYQQPAPANPFGGPFAQQPFGNIPPTPSNPNTFYNTGTTQQAFPGAPFQQPVTGSYQPGGYNGNTYQATGFPPAQPSSPPPMMSGFQPGGNYLDDQSDQPPDQKRGPRVGLIIGLILLIVVLVGAGLGGYFYLRHGTPTAQATPTPIPPTATPTGKALFSDKFTNNNNGWDTSSKAGEYAVTVGQGKMTVEDDNNRLLWELLPGTHTNYGNFYLTIDATLSKGTPSNGYGIYIRGASSSALDIATYYRFELYGDGTYAIFKGSVDASGVSSSTALVTYTTTPVIQKVGKVNHIAINAQGDIMTFWVNGVKLKAVTDNTYASGSIALFVSNLTSTTPGAQATFANLAIYPPQAQ